MYLKMVVTVAEAKAVGGVEFARQLENVCGAVGSKAILEATIKPTSDKCTVKWFKDGKAILSTSKDMLQTFANNELKLTINKLAAAHAGNYEVEVSSTKGKVKCSAKIDISGE
ncbi:hypothetical protein Ciccas_007170 [Cichlidogyrus casuarinus]|uniref:Ig-like domain-containing protein n=1 Tax=Cichlidogyrus casuarinus TaxID=1844966 RepID=A0ABD2Q3K9_9PLAT